MVSVLHHPDREHAPAEQRQAEIGGPTSTELGIVPHQLRGFLGYFTNMIISGHFYDKCVACSDPVVQSYRQKGIDFIIEVCNYPQLLEDITGITEMKKESVDVDVEWDSENDDF
jgi:ubiquitin-like modifier-activating enzyme ATG7